MVYWWLGEKFVIESDVIEKLTLCWFSLNYRGSYKDIKSIYLTDDIPFSLDGSLPVNNSPIERVQHDKLVSDVRVSAYCGQWGHDKPTILSANKAMLITADKDRDNPATS